jgi:hypothetical protein
MSYIPGAEMNLMPKPKYANMRGGDVNVVRTTSWREADIRLFARRGSGRGEEVP